MDDTIRDNFSPVNQFRVLATAAIRNLFAVRPSLQGGFTKVLDNVENVVQTCDPDGDIEFYVNCLKEAIEFGTHWRLSKVSHTIH